ncbi:hypothetical protein HELRODRAFT_164192 [Helobdella robusta]|uniref:DUF4062 domain-containing protein n=1 Tax=Helobdella robusta TaxID=6412 RepID=T1EV29_HELRO|nr:hypothetical protein HELRODRAFT_164192 [Helobdella robusta]ESN94362.1 hypothetical protein HELRODRAFT_164192 [Helobdella robusta]
MTKNITLELCLNEVKKCQFFIGILGERYGSCQFDYGSLESTKDTEWISKHPPGASLTELEFHQCFQSLPQKDKAFFYFRDPSFIQTVPEKHHHLLIDENAGKLKKLKKLVSSSGYEVYDNYPCSWGGVKDGRPIVTNLEAFGNRVIDNLWNAILKTYPENLRHAEMQMLTKEEDSKEKMLTNDSYTEYMKNKFVGRKKLLNKALDIATTKKNGIVLITGKAGSGKSLLIASLIHKLFELKSNNGNHRVFVHCVGAYPASNDIINILKYFIVEIGNSYKLPTVFVPDKYNTYSECHEMLKNRPGLSEVLEVGDLEGTDKADIVRASLLNYGKRLDESAFNMQMKLLMMKKESKSPLYLELVCDEMKKCGDYQLISSKLSSLSSTTSTLLQDILKGAEMEYGEMFVKSALSLLVLSKKGCCTC